jgi:hypothetical protein
LSTRKTPSPRKRGRNSDIVGRKTRICTLQKACSIGALGFYPLLTLDKPSLAIVQSLSPNGIPPLPNRPSQSIRCGRHGKRRFPSGTERSTSKGERLTFGAEHSPSKGERSSSRGKQFSSRGKSSSSKGERLPSKGESFPPKGGRLSSRGESIRSQGERLRSAKRLPLKRAEASSSLTTESAPKGGRGVCLRQPDTLRGSVSLSGWGPLPETPPAPLGRRSRCVLFVRNRRTEPGSHEK